MKIVIRWLQCKMILGLVPAIFLLACGGNNQAAGRTNNQQSGVRDVLEAGMAEADKSEESSDSDIKTQNETGIYDEISAIGETGADNKTGTGGTVAVEDNGTDETARQNGVNDNAPEPEISLGEGTLLSDTEGIDVDLTSLSSTMVYSEVYNMMLAPETYIGKTVRMDGIYTMFHDDASGNNYYACIIQDATACCAQGIEFILTDNYHFPNDYPNEGDEIVVTGVFDTYKEGEYTYCTLRNANLE